jgi:alpha-D-ribose 1-methylphosphonate 5-triphosphate synthase subunit PhnI
MSGAKRYTIMVDFDGTIVDFAFPEIGALKAGVKEALGKLKERYTIVISSCRSSALFKKPNPEEAIPGQRPADGRDYTKEMENFLNAYEVPYDRIDRGDEGKVVAVAYIDDRGIRFENNWAEIVEKMISGGYEV